MRPPLNAGENMAQEFLGGIYTAASMRPPLNAGENGSRHSTRAASSAMLQ